VASKQDRELRLQHEATVLDYLQTRGQEIADGDIARRNRSVATVLGREQLFLEQLRTALQDVFEEKLASPVVKAVRGSTKVKTLRILNLISSDTHYGSNLDPREVGHKYGPTEEARRTAHIMRQVAGYKRDHRDVTELYWHILGDMIQGQLHDMRDGAPLAEQVAACIRILIQAMRYLAVEFPRGVTIFCTPGNHGRNTARHRERATNQKWDSIETMIYVALKEAAAFLPNVKVVLDYQPEYYWNAFGSVGLGTHGDTVIQPGYPGKSINVEGISRQVDKINNARVMKQETPLSMVIVGHVHTGSMTHLPGGTIAITNGCLIPPDAYAKSIGIFETACGQWMWESVPGHPVGDARFITVNSVVDQDKSLDAIIKPFTRL
jgi:hypothetical protein